MSNYDNSNSGGLWKNVNATHEKAPQLTGNIKLSKSLLREAAELAQGEDEITINLSAWKATTDHPKAPVLNIKASVFKPKQEMKPVPKEEKDPWS